MDYSERMGALWEKSKNGKRYMTGYVTIDGVKHNLVLFTNNKRPDKQDPDWQIFPSKPQEDAPF